jgi:hypothetical protein
VRDGETKAEAVSELVGASDSERVAVLAAVKVADVLGWRDVVRVSVGERLCVGAIELVRLAVLAAVVEIEGARVLDKVIDSEGGAELVRLTVLAAVNVDVDVAGMDAENDRVSVSVVVKVFVPDRLGATEEDTDAVPVDEGDTDADAELKGIGVVEGEMLAAGSDTCNSCSLHHNTCKHKPRTNLHHRQGTRRRWAAEGDGIPWQVQLAHAGAGVGAGVQRHAGRVHHAGAQGGIDARDGRVGQVQHRPHARRRVAPRTVGAPAVQGVVVVHHQGIRAAKVLYLSK